MALGVRIVQPHEFSPVGNIVGVDFETVYTSEYSVSTMGVYAYCNDPRFHAWAVAVSDGVTACACDPYKFPWHRIDGMEWVSHNREFDASVFGRLGLSARAKPSKWFCSAAASAFLQYPRDLKGACLCVLGEEVDKSMRVSNKGRFAADDLLACLGMTEDDALYVTTDAVMCLALWREIGPRWPEHERQLFESTCAMGTHGLCVDWDMVEKARASLTARVAECASRIPWHPAMSAPKFNAACAAAGVVPPASTSRSDENFVLWLEEHKDKPIAAHARDVGALRRANRLLSVTDSMRVRRKSNGRMAYELKYFGATPGRWSGGGGLNVQNFNRKEVDGFDVRKCIRAPAGHVLAVLDYSQIEARVLLWLAGAQETLDLLRDHPEWDMYELHARATMGYAEEEALEKFCERTGSGIRQLAKARVLGLGFRCGAGTFVRVARTMAGLIIGFNEAKRIVQEYRDSNPKIVALWEDLERQAWAAYDAGGDCDFTLPFPCTSFDDRCGRYLFYRRVAPHERCLSAVVCGERVPLHGGILAENWTQGTARDVLASAWRRCEAAGYRPVLSVHDELVFELREEAAREELAKIKSIMEAPLPWAPGLPLKASGKLMSRYGK